MGMPRAFSGIADTVGSAGQMRHGGDALRDRPARPAAGRCTDRARRCGSACPRRRLRRLGRKRHGGHASATAASAMPASDRRRAVALPFATSPKLPPMPSVPPKVSLSRIGRDRRRLEAEHLLIVLIEQILHPPEHLHARLQLVGGRGIDQPVGVERHALRREEERHREGDVVHGARCRWRRASPCRARRRRRRRGRRAPHAAAGGSRASPLGSRASV